MVTRKSISQMVSVLIIVMVLLIGFLPTRAESLTSPLYASGDFLWAKSMGGTNSESGYSIAIDSSGNVYTTGSFQGTADFNPGAGTFNLTSTGNDDIFVSKLDNSGNFVWAKRMGGGTSFDYGLGIAVDSIGNIYTIGYFSGTADFDPGAGTFNLTYAGGYGYDIFVSKLDSNGAFVWAKSLGGTGDDNGNGIIVDSSRNVYTTGSFQGTADFNPGVGTFNLTSVGSRDIFVSKLDSSGNFVWAKSMASTGGTNYDQGQGVTVDSSSNVYTTGTFEGTVDFDPGAGTFNLTGSAGGDTFVSKLDSSGNFVWAKKGGSGGGNSIAVDSSSNVYKTGGDFDFGVGGWDISVSKLDSNGNLLWTKNMGGSGNDGGSGIALDSSGNVYTTGSFQGTADFDPGVGTSNLNSAGGSDLFVSKLDNSGNFVWAKRLGGSGNDGGNGIALDSSGNVYTTGGFQGTVDFDPGAGTYNLTSAGLNDIYVSKLQGNFVSPVQRPPLIIVHGFQGIPGNNGYHCSDGIQKYNGTNSTLGYLPSWLLSDYDVWIAHLESTPAGTPSLYTNAQCLRDQINSVALVLQRKVTSKKG